MPLVPKLMPMADIANQSWYTFPLSLVYRRIFYNAALHVRWHLFGISDLVQPSACTDGEISKGGDCPGSHNKSSVFSTTLSHPFLWASDRNQTLSSQESQPLLLLWAESSPRYIAPPTDDFPSGTWRPLSRSLSFQLWLLLLARLSTEEKASFSSFMMFCWHLPKPSLYKQQCQVWGGCNPSRHSAGTSSLQACLINMEQFPFMAWDDSPSVTPYPTPPHPHE